MKQFLLYTFFAIGLSQSLLGQTIASLQAVSLKDSVRITYLLSDVKEGRWYQASLYGIMGGDTLLLTEVSGSGIGDSLQIGPQKIIWNARKELGRYRGSIEFQVRVLPLFYFENPIKDGQILKRDKPYTFRWYGGNSTLDTLTLELYQFDKRVAVIGQAIEAPTYTWKVPANLPLGEGYRIKLIGTERSSLDNFSPSFSVIRKIPLYQIIIPAAIVAVGLPTFLILRRRPLPGAPGDPDNAANPTYITTYPIPQ